MEGSEFYTDILCYYGSQYGAQIVLLAVLSVITVYRREISCNRVYADKDSRAEKSTNDCWNYQEAETLFEGVGLFCSGASLQTVISSLLHVFPGLSELQIYSYSESAWQEKDITEELLDQAGFFCSGAPITTALFRSGPPKLKRLASSSLSSASAEPDNLTSLPPDALVQILQFLHPKDVTTVACTCTTANDFVDTSVSLWKTLWQRDYGWLLESWDIGRQARERSGVNPSFSKDFYFKFSLSFINYVLAGQNTADSCFVGLYGHIFDFEPFLTSHPGSPETVLVQSGTDATEFFEIMRHSKGARRIAQTLCVVVDRSRRGEWGLRPTSNAQLDDPDVGRTTLTASEIESTSTKILCLRSTKETFDKQYTNARSRAAQRWGDASLLSDVHVFYDPLRNEWIAWYMNSNFENTYHIVRD